MKSKLPLRDLFWMILTVPLGVFSAGLLLAVAFGLWMYWQCIGTEIR